MFITIQKKQITKGAKKSKQVFVLNTTKKSKLLPSIESFYVPFSNLALCPKRVIAFVQNPEFDYQELERTVNQLKMPAFAKRQETLIKMRQIASKQDDFKNYLLKSKNNPEHKLG